MLRRRTLTIRRGSVIHVPWADEICEELLAINPDLYLVIRPSEDTSEDVRNGEFLREVMGVHEPAECTGVTDGWDWERRTLKWRP